MLNQSREEKRESDHATGEGFEYERALLQVHRLPSAMMARMLRKRRGKGK